MSDRKILPGSGESGTNTPTIWSRCSPQSRGHDQGKPRESNSSLELLRNATESTTLLGRPASGESGPAKLCVLHWFFRGGRRRTQDAPMMFRESYSPAHDVANQNPSTPRPWGSLHVPPVPTHHKPLHESHRCSTPGSYRSADGCERARTTHLGEYIRHLPPLLEWSRCRCRPDTRTSSGLRATGVGPHATSSNCRLKPVLGKPLFNGRSNLTVPSLPMRIHDRSRSHSTTRQIFRSWEREERRFRCQLGWNAATVSA